MLRERHEAEYTKWLKQQDNLQNGLKHRVEYQLGLIGDPDPTLGQALSIVPGTSTATMSLQAQRMEAADAVNE